MPLTSFHMSCRKQLVWWRTTPPVLRCARRLAHVRPPSDARAPLSPEAIKLRRAMWMRMDPVERWTSLVDLGRRGAYLIEKAQVPLLPNNDAASGAAANRQPTSLPSSSLTHGRNLGSSDDKVRFSKADTEAHRQICAALPYAARLQLCLSLLLWVRCLRDVQDTLARVRLPYAAVRRPQRYAVADVFPTRLSEYWVDVHTTVSTKMSAQLNSTVEQVPAPHTWNVETAETVEDATTESTVALDAGRVLHGRPRHIRLTGKALLKQVQGVQPRASADDVVAARLSEGSIGGGRRRRRHRRLLQEREAGAALSTGASSLSTDTAADLASKRRVPSPEFLPDAARRVPPVSLEPQPAADALYHGNARRGEGCPMNEDGESTPSPIYIHVPPCSQDCRGSQRSADGIAEAEELVRHCVMAHAAILTSLYIEGRVVDFSTNNATVAAYVRWLMAELVTDHYVNVKLIDAETAEAEAYRPYYPSWCWRNVLVVLPPRVRQGIGLRGGGAVGYSTAVIKDWAARIAQAAPCSVMVEGGTSAAAAYVQRLKDEVARLQEGNAEDGLGTSAATAATSPPPAPPSSSRQAVQWVPILLRDTPASVSEDANTLPSPAAPAGTGEDGPATAASSFQPRRTATAARPSFSAVNIALQLVHRAAGVTAGEAEHQHRERNGETAAAVARCERFLSAVVETLHDRFYTCEFLYSPAQSCLTPYRFERWVWEQLPDNVRVVGVNTAPLDVLFYFPQGVFLTQKVGNAFRYRAVERTVVAKDLTSSWFSHPLRCTATQLKRLSRRWRRRRDGAVADGLHAEFSLADRREWRRAAAAAAVSAQSPAAATSHYHSGEQTVHMVEGDEDKANEVASHALVRERTVEYLAEPSKWTLLGLVTARFFRF